MDPKTGPYPFTLDLDKRPAFERALWIVFQFDPETCDLAMDIPDIRRNVEELGMEYFELERNLENSRANLLDEPPQGHQVSLLLTDANWRLEHADYLAIACWDMFGIEKKTVHLGFRDPSVLFRLRDLVTNLWILDKKMTEMVPQIMEKYPDLTIQEIRKFFRQWKVAETKIDKEKDTFGLIIERKVSDNVPKRYVVEYNPREEDPFVIKRIAHNLDLADFSAAWKKNRFTTNEMTSTVNPFSKFGRDMLCIFALRGKGLISTKEKGISTLGQEIIDRLPPAATIQ
jgi:hypothetical protein